MLDCWEKDPIKRPSFLNLSKRLGDLLQKSTKSVSNHKFCSFLIFNNIKT